MFSWLPKEMTLPSWGLTQQLTHHQSVSQPAAPHASHSHILGGSGKKTIWCELSKSSQYLTSPSGVGFISKLKGTEGLGKSKDQQSQEQVVPSRKGSQAGTQNRNQTTDKTVYGICLQAFRCHSHIFQYLQQGMTTLIQLLTTKYLILQMFNQLPGFIKF